MSDGDIGGGAQHDGINQKEEVDRLGRRDVLKTTAGLAIVGVGASKATAADSDLTRLWRVPLTREQTALVTVDTDGDGTDEVVVSDKDRAGPSEYGLLDGGEWVWRHSSPGDVIPSEAGDVDGDGLPEVIIRSKVARIWVRPYTHDGEYLWSGGHGDWPDCGFATDVDGDGRAEVMALSSNRGDLSIFDDDGSVLWRTQDADLLERPFGFADIDGDGHGEVLTNQPPDESRKGVHVVTRGDGGPEVLWSYGPREPVRARFTRTDGDADAAAVVAYPESGEVHGVTADGSQLWVEATGLTDATVRVFDHAGGATAAVWTGSEVRLVGNGGGAPAIWGFSTPAPVDHVAAYDDTRAAAATEDGLVVATADGGVVARHPTDRTINEVAFGDVDGDGEQEVLVSHPDELGAYDIAAGGAGASVRVVDPRVVQTAENTSLDYDVADDAHDPEASTDVADPTLVAGRQSTAVFDLRVDDAEAVSGPVDVRIRNEATGEGGSFTVVPDVLNDDGELPFLARLHNKLGDTDDTAFGAGFGPADYPVFEVSAGDTVTVTVGEQADGVAGYTAEITVGAPVSAPELRIGFVRVDVPFGDEAITSKDYRAEVEQIVEYVQRSFPVDRVKAYRLDRELEGSAVDAGSITAILDGHSARQLLDAQTPIEARSDGGEGTRLLAEAGAVQTDAEIAIEDFDATLAIVSEGYFNDEDRFGVHYYASEPAHPAISALAQIGAGKDVENMRFGGVRDTAAMEIAHHFVGADYDGAFAYTDDGDPDPFHANSSLLSTVFDLEDGTFEFDILQSFMAQSTPGGWADALTWEKLLQGDYQPHPVEGPLIEETALHVSGWVGDAGEITLHDVRESASGVLGDVENGEITLELAGLDDAIGSWDFPGTIFATHDGAASADADVTPIVATIPYPEEAVRLTISADGTTKTVNVATAQLETLVDMLPDAGFARNPAQRKRALRKKIDAVDEMLDEGKLRPAINKLREDVRDKLAKWLRDDFDAAANQYTKDEALGVVDTVIARLEANTGANGDKRGGN